MIKGLLLYSAYFSKLIFRKDRSIVLHDFHRYFNSKSQETLQSYRTPEERSRALDQAVNWLLVAQTNMPDDGIGSYHLSNGWSNSYPETTGYIIPTLLNYAEKYNDKPYLNKAISAADWLLGIQKPSGGWQGGRMNEDQAEVVFNTGQVMRGLLAAYQAGKDEKHLDSCIKAGNWLCDIQHPEGYWKDFALMNRERVYDSYLDVPLLYLYQITDDQKYYKHALKNLMWIVEEKQQLNGWFEDCDNTVRHNNRPILHTIAYTIDGLLDAGVLIQDEALVHAAHKSADILLKLFEEEGRLYGRYDRNWTGSEYMIVTGCAQMSIVWLKLFKHTRDQRYLDAAMKMNDLLIFIQDRKVMESDNTNGAIPGSFPIWGKYEPFAFPNWATKYFADALMLESEVNKNEG